jgi:hypothetical protein
LMMTGTGPRSLSFRSAVDCRPRTIRRPLKVSHAPTPCATNQPVETTNYCSPPSSRGKTRTSTYSLRSELWANPSAYIGSFIPDSKTSTHDSSEG